MAIKRRGDGYEVRWLTVGKRSKRRRCPSLRTARQLEAEIHELKARGRDWEPQPAAASREPTVSEIALAYQDARRLRCRPATVRVEGMHLDLFLRFLDGRAKGPALVTSLSRAVLDEFMGWLMRPENGLHGRQRAAVSVVKSVRAAQLLWRWAEESERWPGIPRPRTVELPRTIPGAVVAPSWAEMDACIAACRGWQRALATWLRYTGLRAGESMQLRWTDVDLARGTLTIRPEIDKTGQGRVVPLAPPILDEIATWGVREGYLLPCGRLNHRRDPRARDIARAWVRSGAREAIYRQRPEHAFRRGWKSGMLALGCDRDAVDFLQGHGLGAGSRGRYIDPWAALPLVETVARVPVIGVVDNVVKLEVRR